MNFVSYINVFFFTVGNSRLVIRLKNVKKEKEMINREMLKTRREDRRRSYLSEIESCRNMVCKYENNCHILLYILSIIMM